MLASTGGGFTVPIKLVRVVVPDTRTQLEIIRRTAAPRRAASILDTIYLCVTIAAKLLEHARGIGRPTTDGFKVHSIPPRNNGPPCRPIE